MNTCFRYITSCFVSMLMLFAGPSVLSQSAVPIGHWRTHVSYSSVTSIAMGNQKVYAACSTGLMVLDLSDNSLSVLTGLKGLPGDVSPPLPLTPPPADLL